jgi:hypothetical protein
MTIVVMINMLLILLVILFQVRNILVFEERMLMTGLIFAQQDYMPYLRAKLTVSYDYMVYHFWVWPVSKMWPTELQSLRSR